ncbi:hypothetical protein ACM792_14600 [Metapseudomonas otitidis]|uniref:hypothetical protein n=1 Tax=Metapseudomonas otitidis TaxID=319939 RepID=UPI0039FCDA12
MSEKPLIDYKYYSSQDAEDQRVIAVNAALELIAARMTSAPSNGTHLLAEMQNLSTYADLIQAALKT